MSYYLFCGIQGWDSELFSCGSVGCCPGPQSSQGLTGARGSISETAHSQQVGAGGWWEASVLPHTGLSTGLPRALPAPPPSSLSTRDPRPREPGRRCILLMTYPWKCHSIVVTTFYLLEEALSVVHTQGQQR